MDDIERQLRERALSYALRQDAGEDLPAGPGSGDVHAIAAWVRSCDLWAAERQTQTQTLMTRREALRTLLALTRPADAVISGREAALCHLDTDGRRELS